MKAIELSIYDYSNISCKYVLKKTYHSVCGNFRQRTATGRG